MAAQQTLREAFVEELRDLLSSEKQLVKALPRLARAATSPELRTAFERHLHETEAHAERLGDLLTRLGGPIRARTCDGMEGIVSEGEKMIAKAPEGAVRDAVLINAAQKAEHYEIASYGTAIAWARALGESDAAETLSTSLAEEKAADEKLSAIATSVNGEALTPLNSER